VEGDVVDLADGLGFGGGGGKEIHLNGVGHITEVTAGFAVAVDLDGLILDHGRDPLGDDGGIGAVGVLARAEDIEIAKADGFGAIAAAEDGGVKFVDVFGDGVRRERSADPISILGRPG
jgi:hypothetical protein